jgi:hypothetical protein
MIDYKFLFLTKESFKFIKNFENYMVSDYGKVFSIKSHRFLKPFIDGRGYYRVNLYNNGIRKFYRIHRLVALQFLENPENKNCIDHVNGNVKDNTINNLRWASKCENSHNAKIRKDNTTGIKGIYFKKSINKYCVQIRINNKQKHIGYFYSLDEATLARKKAANEIFKEFTNACEKIN